MTTTIESTSPGALHSSEFLETFDQTPQSAEFAPEAPARPLLTIARETLKTRGMLRRTGSRLEAQIADGTEDSPLGLRLARREEILSTQLQELRAERQERLGGIRAHLGEVARNSLTATSEFAQEASAKISVNAMLAHNYLTSERTGDRLRKARIGMIAASVVSLAVTTYLSNRGMDFGHTHNGNTAASYDLDDYTLADAETGQDELAPILVEPADTTPVEALPAADELSPILVIDDSGEVLPSDLTTEQLAAFDTHYGDGLWHLAERLGVDPSLTLDPELSQKLLDLPGNEFYPGETLTLPDSTSVELAHISHSGPMSAEARTIVAQHFGLLG